MVPDGDDTMPSSMSFNGIDDSNILYTEDKNNGIYQHDNLKDSSTWTVQIDTALWNNKHIFKAFKKKKCGATIATASNYIKVPPADFSYLAEIMHKNNEEFVSNGTSIFAE